MQTMMSEAFLLSNHLGKDCPRKCHERRNPQPNLTLSSPTNFSLLFSYPTQIISTVHIGTSTQHILLLNLYHSKSLHVHAPSQSPTKADVRMRFASTYIMLSAHGGSHQPSPSCFCIIWAVAWLLPATRSAQSTCMQSVNFIYLKYIRYILLCILMLTFKNKLRSFGVFSFLGKGMIRGPPYAWIHWVIYALLQKTYSIFAIFQKQQKNSESGPGFH